MTRPHYIVDLFFPDGTRPGGLRADSFTIAAGTDEGTIREPEIASIITPPSVGPRVKPAFFRVSRVFRKRTEVLFDSSKVHPS